MTRALHKWTDLDLRDYVGLLKLSGDYVIRELSVKEDDWLAGKKLNACSLRDEGVSVLGIYRSNGNYVGVPKADTVIHPGDRLVLYGRAAGLTNLDRRHSGDSGERDRSHAVGEEQQRMKQQEREEEAFKQGKDRASQGKNQG